MLFKLDQANQAPKVIISRKTNRINHPALKLNSATVNLTQIKKHLDHQLHSKLLFNEQTSYKISKPTKGMRLLCKL